MTKDLEMTKNLAMESYKTDDKNWYAPEIPKGPTKEEFVENIMKKHFHFIAKMGPGSDCFSFKQEKAIYNFVKNVLMEIV